MGANYKSRERNVDIDTTINSTTFAQWSRNISDDEIRDQIAKLSGLNIEKLDIDYKVVNRDSNDREYLNSDAEALLSGDSSLTLGNGKSMQKLKDFLHNDK